MLYGLWRRVATVRYNTLANSIKYEWFIKSKLTEAIERGMCVWRIKNASQASLMDECSHSHLSKKKDYNNKQEETNVDIIKVWRHTQLLVRTHSGYISSNTFLYWISLDVSSQYLMKNRELNILNLHFPLMILA